MWIGFILLGLENNGLWLVEHRFSASGENRIHTHTDVTKEWPAVWIGGLFFLGPCVIGRLWLFGHWTTKKNIGSQKFDWRFFQYLRFLSESWISESTMFLWYSWISSFFQIYLFNANLHKRRSLLRWASERAALCLFFRCRRRSCRVLVSTFSWSLVVRCERRRRRGNTKLLKNFENKEKRQETSEEF